MNTLPGTPVSLLEATTARMSSPDRDRPLESTKTQRSPSGSKATPMSEPVAVTSAFRVSEAVGPFHAIFPSGSQLIATHCTPSFFKISGAAWKAAPFPQSTQTLRPADLIAAASTCEATAWMYSGMNPYSLRTSPQEDQSVSDGT